MTHTRWISCSFAAWLLAIGLTSAHPLSAQATPDTNAPAKAVSLPVTVLDKHGKIATNLSKDDFVLQEDGRFQDIGSIVPAGDLPLTIGLAVDTSRSQRSALGQERDASSNFLDQILRGDKDQAFLIHFDQEVELDQDVTSSREKLRAGLQSMQAPQFSQTSGDRDQDDQHRRGAKPSSFSPTAWTATARRLCTRPSRPRSGRMRWCMRSTSSPSSNPSAAIAVATVPGAALWADTAAAGSGVIPRSSVPTARRSWSRLPTKPAAGSLKLQEKRPWARSTRRSRKSCAASTA